MSNGIGTSIDGFEPAPARLVGEQWERIERGKQRLWYRVSFLDDYLRGIAPNDLILLGAPSGMGKTDLALNIAASNAMEGKRVHYFALEAEPRELERRTKYAIISREVHRSKHPERERLNYSDWVFGDLEDICGPFNRIADDRMLEMLCGLQTYYRGVRFTTDHLQKAVLAVFERSKLIVVDHLHYIDTDDENEHRALGDTVKTIRDISLRIGVPIILVAHLRKRDPRAKQLIASLDDFHGSSNIVKIATQVIAIEKATCVESDKWYVAPTFMSVLKDRRGGASPYVAVAQYDIRTKGYEPKYSLGKISGQEWTPIELHDKPRWAEHYSPGQIATERTK